MLEAQAYGYALGRHDEREAWNHYGFEGDDVERYSRAVVIARLFGEHYLAHNGGLPLRSAWNEFSDALYFHSRLARLAKEE